MKFFFLTMFALVLSLVEVSCYKCVDAQCSNVPPIDPVPPDWPQGELVETFPDDSPQAVSSPCGLSCANWKKLDCPESKPTSEGVSCYRQCVKRATLIRIPSKCWIEAKTVAALRSCGGIRCVP